MEKSVNIGKKLNYVILIPAYNPDDKFVAFVSLLREQNINVIAVNDGSRTECKKYFEAAEEKGCIIVHHEVNKGKGQSLRTGFSEVIKLNEKGAGYDYVVTADCDGQHDIKAITEVVKAAEESVNGKKGPAIIIGGRFRDSIKSKDAEKVPFKSKFGNGVTRFLFKVATGISVHDTQTGLRAVPERLFKEMLKIKGNRYEYEMNMLLQISTWGVPYKEIPINTIYFDNNEGSHFNPLRDSFLVIFQILKFIASSVLSFLVDYVLFIILGHWFSYVPSYAIARVTSGVANYFLNAGVVFGKISRRSAIKYFILWLVILFVGSQGGRLLNIYCGMPEILCKICVDVPLFCLSYYIQKRFVFRK